jgi:hypothetical protein
VVSVAVRLVAGRERIRAGVVAVAVGYLAVAAAKLVTLQIEAGEGVVADPISHLDTRLSAFRRLVQLRQMEAIVTICQGSLQEEREH